MESPADDKIDRLYTVGHSNHEPPALLALLRRAGVTAVADVRSSPYSRRLPQFSRPELERGLPAHGIATATIAIADLRPSSVLWTTAIATA